MSLIFNNVTKRINFTNARMGDKTAGPLILAGTSATPLETTTADTKIMQFYLKNSATSGDNRGMYLRLYLTGAGGGGEALRVFTTVDDVAGGTAHGAHISLNFDTSGTVTGLGVAVRGTLHIPDVASWTPGTITALQGEIYSDGTASDAGAATELSYIRLINDGHANGIADVDDDVFLFSLQGHTVGVGNLIAAKTSAAVSHTARMKIGSTTYYIMLSNAQ